MAHPLYHQLRMHVNKPVTVHLRSGRSHYGYLSRVAANGIYLTPGTRQISGTESNETYIVETADNPNEQFLPNVEKAFWPFFFPFAALAGFTLGFAVGALATPYYGYGYGYY